MNNLQTNGTSPSFRALLCFLAIAIVGFIVLPYLRVNLLPEEKSSTFTVSFSLSNASPIMVEQQVTSLIEGACSQIPQLRNISSVSNYNNGYVVLQFERDTDMEYKQLEISSLIRQLYKSLPTSTTYPVIVPGSNNRSEVGPLLVYTINGPLLTSSLRQYSENVFEKALRSVKGVKEVTISGSDHIQLVIKFFKDKCDAWNIDPSQIASTIQSVYSESFPGTTSGDTDEELFFHFRVPESSISSIEKTVLKVHNSKVIFLKDVASINFEEEEPDSYFRINGTNAVRLGIFAERGENATILSGKIKRLLSTLAEKLPKDLVLQLDQDNTKLIEKEIEKNSRRAILSICILLIFSILIYRDWTFIVNLLSGLAITLLLVGILAWFFHIEVHMYTIAGLTVSFGIITDNSIVVLDYLKKWRSRRILNATLASTISTVSAVCLVFFLPEEERQNLTDFAFIIALTLASSVIVSFWFTPAMYAMLFDRFMSGQVASMTSKKKFWIDKFRTFLKNLYVKVVETISHYKKTFSVGLLFLFGLPIFMLPDEWEGDNWYNSIYNTTIGNKDYQQSVRPTVDKVLGGTLYYFVRNIYEQGGYRDPEKTKLFIKAELSHDNTVAQLNDVLSKVEAYLTRVKGVEKIVTNVQSPLNGVIEVNFLSGDDLSTLPYRLKESITRIVSDIGGVKWMVYGVGRGYSSSGIDESPQFQLTMQGYNYEELERQADILKRKLLRHKRIKDVNIDKGADYLNGNSKEYVLNLDASRMAIQGTNRFEILSNVASMSKQSGSSGSILIGNEYYPLISRESESENFSNFDLLQKPSRLDSGRYLRILDVGKIELRDNSNSIQKENRQYIRNVSFIYQGSVEFGNDYLDSVLDEMQSEMPVGYTIARNEKAWNWGKTQREYSLILILIAVIFLIASILFENLRQAFVVISVIPLSFIGLFLTFSIGDFYFDQGGYAAFVLLGGLVVNAAIYIVNDLNILRSGRPTAGYNQLLIEAIFKRSRTILLTTISTCCGLLPFIFEGNKEVFWFSLAIGTVGGLIFSVFAVFFVLPVFLWKRV